MSTAPNAKKQAKAFELHVTFAENPAMWPVAGWTLSRIEGDPDLGSGARWYATTHAPTLRLALQAIEQAEARWPEALRYKVEHVVYDSLGH